MGEQWRTTVSRELAQKIRRAGGRVKPIGLGRMLVTGPHGQVTIAEPDARPHLSGAVQLIAEHTGLDLNGR